MAVVSNWFLKDTNKYLEEKRLCIARIRCIIYQFGWRGLTHEVLSVTWYEAIKVEIFCSYHDGDFNHTARPLHAGEVMFTVCGAFGCAGNQFQQEVYGMEINCFTLPETEIFFFYPLALELFSWFVVLMFLNCTVQHSSVPRLFIWQSPVTVSSQGWGLRSQPWRMNSGGVQKPELTHIGAFGPSQSRAFSSPL